MALATALLGPWPDSSMSLAGVVCVIVSSLAAESVVRWLSVVIIIHNIRDYPHHSALVLAAAGHHNRLAYTPLQHLELEAPRCHHPCTHCTPWTRGPQVQYTAMPQWQLVAVKMARVCCMRPDDGTSSFGSWYCWRWRGSWDFRLAMVSVIINYLGVIGL